MYMTCSCANYVVVCVLWWSGKPPPLLLLQFEDLYYLLSLPLEVEEDSEASGDTGTKALTLYNDGFMQMCTAGPKGTISFCGSHCRYDCVYTNCNVIPLCVFCQLSIQ